MTLKTGARMAIENLGQAVVEADRWTKRRDQLVLDCANLGWPYQTIADVVGCSYSAVAVRVYRARKAAREAS